MPEQEIDPPFDSVSERVAQLRADRERLAALVPPDLLAQFDALLDDIDDLTEAEDDN